ncbi:MAG: hypothetical protein H0X67_12955, partial [Acidobacteria bacterium]|nr:hypothetical protein [Acidobacteriota bacterium]
MPPRHVYWTIILEGKPTAFRAHTQEELLPTLRQLQAKHPEAEMKWFARGRLWHSQEEERMAAALKRSRTGERRPPTWRPGGEHEDPRERFKVPRDVKRSKFASKLRKERVAREAPPEGGPPPSGDRPPRPDWKPGGRPHGDRPAGDRPPRPDWKPGGRPPGERPAGDRPPRPDWKPGGRPHGDRPAGDRPPRPDWKPGG